MEDEEMSEELRSFFGPDDCIAIVGLGNVYKGDDGAGIAFISQLKEYDLPEHISIFEAGRNLLGIMPDIAEAAPLSILFVDAANLGLEPGEARLIAQENILEAGISTHENNFAMALSYLEKKVPDCRVLFLGIQFQSIELSEGLTLTQRIKEKVNEIAGLVAVVLGS